MVELEDEVLRKLGAKFKDININIKTDLTLT